MDGSGAGKSASYSKPNAYQKLGSYVFTDPKGELYDDTAGYLQRNGYKIKVLNLVNPKNSDGYNPLAHIKSDLDVDVIASTIVKGQGKAGAADPFWDDTAEMLLKSLIYYLIATRPPEEQNLASCAEMVRAAAADSNGSNLLKEMMSVLPIDHPARTYFKNVEVASEKTFSSILVSVQAKLGKFDSKDIAEVTSTDTINFDEIGSTLTSVYVISSDTHTAYDFLLTIFFAQMIQQLYDLADRSPGGKLKVPTFFILDEFANIGQIPDFDKKISTSRSRKISFSVILQNLDQLEAIYDKSYETIMGNCDTHLFLGSNSTKTVEYFSKALGEKTISRNSTSKSKDKDGHKSGTSDSEQIMARALMTPDELRRMSMDYCIIYEKGIKPVKAHKLFFFKTNMIKEFNKFKLNHNQFDAGVRGVWRKFNPYNPDAGLEEEQTKDLKIESLDDLFDDDNVNDDIANKKTNKNDSLKAESIEDMFDDSEPKGNSSKPKTTNKTNMSDSELDELLFDDFDNEENDIESDNDILDIQKELEAKFDELFGPIDDDSDN
ncbi:MAG: type IV secretory system conjugative DNA transfer family protein [Clostridia bacterium]|nr:type IV secretory system conjugative DNA transfer family protein [Clostridia bacterium]